MLVPSDMIGPQSKLLFQVNKFYGDRVHTRKYNVSKTIREICVKSDNKREEAGLDNNDRDSLGPEAEDLIVQMFEIVNEKNELFRRQTELMYMKKEHRWDDKLL